MNVLYLVRWSTGKCLHFVLGVTCRYCSFFSVRIVREPNFCSRTELFSSQVFCSKTELFELRDVRKPRFDCITKIRTLYSLSTMFNKNFNNF